MATNGRAASDFTARPLPATVAGVIVAVALTVAGQLPAQAAEAEVRTTADAGAAIAVEARAVLAAPAALIWQTLTDYARLPEFIPGMRRSRVIDRNGTTAIVEQDGEASFLFLKFPIHVVVESREFPPSVINIRIVRGNLRQLEGRYRIANGESGNQRVLTWSGIIEPDSILPSFLTVSLMRRDIESQFAGMVHEIERRDAERMRQAAAPGASD